jgi:predicted dehydrogenase
MNICWGTPQFPHRVMAGGGIYAFPDREVPDTFHLIADYAQGYSVVLSSSMANSQHIPGLIRGKDASLIMVEHGRFEGYAPYITVKPEQRASKEYLAKFGKDDIKIEVENKNTMDTHINNFLDCIRSRQQPTLNVETAARAQVLITMAVNSYREGKVLYFDEKKFKVVDKAPKA